MINFKLIGQRIKTQRLNSGYTQEHFAELLGISIEHLSRIETGACRPSLRLIEDICNKLKTSEEEIMFGNKNSNLQNAELADKIAYLTPEKQKALSIIIDLLTD